MISRPQCCKAHGSPCDIRLGRRLRSTIAANEPSAIAGVHARDPLAQGVAADFQELFRSAVSTWMRRLRSGAHAVRYSDCRRLRMYSKGMPTVAVLPFCVVDGNDPAQDDFARGLTGEVSAYLSTFPDMHTLAISDPAAKLAHRNQPRQSNATYLLEGDVAKANGKNYAFQPA